MGFEVGLALTYGIMVGHRGEAIPLLDFNGLRSLPSLLQAAHLLALSGLCGYLVSQRRRLVRPCSWFLPLALALLCGFGAIDELTKLHLTLPQVNWKLIYLSLLVAIPLVGWRDLRWLWQTQHPIVVQVGLGLGVFLLGGFGAEAAKGAIATTLTASADPQLVVYSEHLRITVEEFAELLGETIILYSFAQFTQQNLRPPSPDQPPG